MNSFPVVALVAIPMLLLQGAIWFAITYAAARLAFRHERRKAERPAA